MEHCHNTLCTNPVSDCVQQDGQKLRNRTEFGSFIYQSTGPCCMSSWKIFSISIQPSTHITVRCTTMLLIAACAQSTRMTLYIKSSVIIIGLIGAEVAKSCTLKELTWHDLGSSGCNRVARCCRIYIFNTILCLVALIPIIRLAIFARRFCHECM